MVSSSSGTSERIPRLPTTPTTPRPMPCPPLQFTTMPLSSSVATNHKRSKFSTLMVNLRARSSTVWVSWKRESDPFLLWVSIRPKPFSRLPHSMDLSRSTPTRKRRSNSPRKKHFTKLNYLYKIKKFSLFHHQKTDQINSKNINNFFL